MVSIKDLFKNKKADKQKMVVEVLEPIQGYAKTIDYDSKIIDAYSLKTMQQIDEKFKFPTVDKYGNDWAEFYVLPSKYKTKVTIQAVNQAATIAKDKIQKAEDEAIFSNSKDDVYTFNPFIDLSTTKLTMETWWTMYFDKPFLQMCKIVNNLSVLRRFFNDQKDSYDSKCKPAHYSVVVDNLKLDLKGICEEIATFENHIFFNEIEQHLKDTWHVEDLPNQELIEKANSEIFITYEDYNYFHPTILCSDFFIQSKMYEKVNAEYSWLPFLGCPENTLYVVPLPHKHMGEVLWDQEMQMMFSSLKTFAVWERFRLEWNNVKVIKIVMDKPVEITP